LVFKHFVVTKNTDANGLILDLALQSSHVQKIDS